MCVMKGLLFFICIKVFEYLNAKIYYILAYFEEFCVTIPLQYRNFSLYLVKKRKNFTKNACRKKAIMLEYEI